MTFKSREEAGQKLGQFLAEKKVQVDLVMGLPRGGVVVAAAVARALALPLDVIVVRKIGHPFNREYAVGAIAEADTIVTDSEQSWLNQAEVEEIMAEEKTRLNDYCAKFHRDKTQDIKGKKVLLVDDGLATGATTEAAVRSAKKLGALDVTVAVPVASPSGVDRLKKVADKILSLLVDPEFAAVGQYYLDFPQTTDDEVLKLLTAGSSEK